jgi:hypothetical protein
MCASDETVTALLLVVLEKRIQPTQLNLVMRKSQRCLPHKIIMKCFRVFTPFWIIGGIDLSLLKIISGRSDDAIRKLR